MNDAYFRSIQFSVLATCAFLSPFATFGLACTWALISLFEAISQESDEKAISLDKEKK